MIVTKPRLEGGNSLLSFCSMNISIRYRNGIGEHDQNGGSISKVYILTLMLNVEVLVRLDTPRGQDSEKAMLHAGGNLELKGSKLGRICWSQNV